MANRRGADQRRYRHGKNNLCCKKLNEWAEITGTKILYLCNRSALKSQVVKQAEAEEKAKALNDGVLE